MAWTTATSTRAGCFCCCCRPRRWWWWCVRIILLLSLPFSLFIRLFQCLEVSCRRISNARRRLIPFVVLVGLLVEGGSVVTTTITTTTVSLLALFLHSTVVVIPMKQSLLRKVADTLLRRRVWNSKHGGRRGIWLVCDNEISNSIWLWRTTSPTIKLLWYQLPAWYSNLLLANRCQYSYFHNR